MKVGDEVVVLECYINSYDIEKEKKIGLRGLVKDVSITTAGVEFYTNINGHDLEGKGNCKDGYGWWIEREYLKVVEPETHKEEIICKDAEGNELRVGDRFYLVRYPDVKGRITKGNAHGKKDSFFFDVERESRESWEYGRNIIKITQTQKEEREMSTSMSEVILAVYEKSEDAKVVNKHFKAELENLCCERDFTQTLWLEEYKEEYLAEAKRLQEEEDKKEG